MATFSPGFAAIERLADAKGIMQRSRHSLPDTDQSYWLDDDASALVLMRRDPDLPDIVHDGAVKATGRAQFAMARRRRAREGIVKLTCIRFELEGSALKNTRAGSIYSERSLTLERT